MALSTMPNGSNASASRSSLNSGGKLPTKTFPLLLRTHMQPAVAAPPSSLERCLGERCDAAWLAVNCPSRYGRASLLCNNRPSTTDRPRRPRIERLSHSIARTNAARHDPVLSGERGRRAKIPPGTAHHRARRSAPMPAIKPIPDGYNTLTPYLIVSDGAGAIAFYAKAFGATERMRLDAPGGRIGHAELTIGDFVIMLADELREHGRAVAVERSAGRRSGCTSYVPDVDAVIARAVAAGGKLLQRARRPVLRRPQQHDRGSVRAPLVHLDPCRGRSARRDRPPRRSDARAKRNDPARPHRVFRDRRSPPTAPARRRPPRRLDDRQSRGLGHFSADGAAGLAGTDRPGAAARRAELGMARIWHAGRRLALLRPVPKARHPSDGVDQRAGLRGLRARRPRVPATRAGSSWVTPGSRCRSTRSRTSAP